MSYIRSISTMAYHFSDGRFPPVLEHSGGSYFSRTGNILIGGMDSGPEAGYMKSTPPSFHSPARSTKTDVTLTLLWTRLQSTFRKLSAFCNNWTLSVLKNVTLQLIQSKCIPALLFSLKRMLVLYKLI